MASVGVQERTGTSYDGGLRRRVHVELDDGETYLFIMKHPEETAEELRQLMVGKRYIRRCRNDREAVT